MQNREFASKIMPVVLACLLSACSDERDIGKNLDRRLSDQELNFLERTESRLDNDTFYFGFDVRASAKEDARQYLPFLDYLHHKTGYRFKLRFTPKDSDLATDIGNGRIHFAALGAVSYIRANRKYGAVTLVRGVNQQGKDRYRAVLVVKPTSEVHRVEDIKGHRFAFGARSSTQGHLIPQIIFQQKHINIADLKSYIFTGSHLNCLNSVLLSNADVCGMQDVMGESAAEQGKVRIVHYSNWYPSSGIIVNKDVSITVRNKVKAALLAFRPTGEDAKLLYNWDKTEMARGFVEAKDQDYADLRQWMKRLALQEFN